MGIVVATSSPGAGALASSGGAIGPAQEHHQQVASRWESLTPDLLHHIVAALSSERSAAECADVRLVCVSWAAATAGAVEYVRVGSRPAPAAWTSRFANLSHLEVRNPALGLRDLATSEEWTELGRLTRLSLPRPAMRKDAICARGLPKLRHLRVEHLQTAEASTMLADLEEQERTAAQAQHVGFSSGMDSDGSSASLLFGGLPGTWPLHSLDVQHCDNLLTDVELRRLVVQLPQLRSLHLGACIAVSDAGMEAVSRLPQLTALSLDGAAITERGLLSLSRLHELAKVSLRHATLLTPAAVTAWLNRLTCSLTQLEVTECLDDSGLRSLAACCPCLELLVAEACQITDSGIGCLGRLASLTSLSLRSCYQISDAGLAFLPANQCLRHLDLVNTSVTDTGLMALPAQFPKLARLVMGLDASCQLCPARNLRSRTCGLSDRGMRALQGLPSLTALSISDCNLVTSEGVAALAPLTHLQELDLDWNVDDEGLAALCHLPHLARLSLSGACDVSAAGLSKLQQLTSLTDLHVSDCHDLAQLAPLSGATTLRRLSLPGSCGLGPGMLPALLHLTRLRELRLGSTKGREEIIQGLRGKHPSLRELTFSFATTSTVHL